MDEELLSKHSIEFYQATTIEEFRRKFSREASVPPHFEDPIGHFTTNEYDYPQSLKEINVRGGIHLAVMGGSDPVLGQVAVAQPDLTIMLDINEGTVNTIINGRIKPIEQSTDGKDYWEKVRDFFSKEVRKIDPKRYDFPTDQDIRLGGWSNQDYFNVVKASLSQGKIKCIKGDIVKDGLDLAQRIARDTGIPIRLIYLSNIFDYKNNNKGDFSKRLESGLNDGSIDENAQVIDTSGEGPLETRVFGVKQYLGI